jgi:plasmid stabilization system protein ParE
VKTVTWEPEATDELDHALSRSRNPGAFRRAIDDALDDIATGRVTHNALPGTLCRRCVLNTPPFSIIYVEAADGIRVIALPHHKRRTNYWTSRLPGS